MVYLAQKFGNLSSEAKQIALANEWVLFANATLGPSLLTENSRATETPRFIQPIEALLTEHPFLLGDQFTVASPIEAVNKFIKSHLS